MLPANVAELSRSLGPRIMGCDTAGSIVEKISWIYGDMTTVVTRVHFDFMVPLQICHEAHRIIRDDKETNSNRAAGT